MCACAKQPPLYSLTVRYEVAVNLILNCYLMVWYYFMIKHEGIEQRVIEIRLSTYQNGITETKLLLS